MEIKHTRRKSDYFHDINHYGKRGEQHFEQREIPKYEAKGYKCFNVTEIKEYQYADIDYVVDVKGRTELPDFTTVTSCADYIKIEVKLDTRRDTGNLVYESISHNSRGWSELTLADYAYFVMTDGENLESAEYYYIRMDEWRQYCNDRHNHKKVNIIDNGDRDLTVDLLCRRSDLIQKGILKKA